MDLVLSDDQKMIREEATRLLAERSTSERVREVVEAAQGVDAELWATIAGELGWCAMAIPEAFGGLGLGMTEQVLLMEAVGRRLAALPLWSTSCMAAPLIAAVGGDTAKAELLGRIAGGEAATVAWDIFAVDPLAHIGFDARASGDGYVIEGRAAQVSDLLAAAIVLVPAQLDGGLALFALPAGTGNSALLPTLDGTRQIGELTLDPVALPASARVDAAGFDAADADAAIASAMLGLAAEQIGAACGVMDVTLDYIASRVQFGRTIASFQAIKHRCARLEVDFSEARSLVYGAAAGFDATSPAERGMEIAAARALAGDLLYRASEEAIQLHGGVGFTWEYDPHLYFKRAQAASCLLGATHAHLGLIADALLGAEEAR
ncbi:acyl-CoA dehydrogenase family protein [Aquamicrobium sp. LC103]|uniref:acyl-CoA dehydrogenase family protein n=1 Tax=Aquamicrobium sp. LC103 TaxID=1120658 RepID=UPI00063EC7AD|nr:acyl-CoA dehydrogenase family protein [Aquamicrobium sp. LC103]